MIRARGRVARAVTRTGCRRSRCWGRRGRGVRGRRTRRARRRGVVFRTCEPGEHGGAGCGETRGPPRDQADTLAASFSRQSLIAGSSHVRHDRQASSEPSSDQVRIRRDGCGGRVDTYAGSMLMPMRFRDGITQGDITLTFRRWKRCQVVAGHRYRTAAGRIEVDEVDVVDPNRITNADARRAGFASRAELLAELRGADDLPTYRIRFHAVDGPDERDTLAATAAMSSAEITELTRRLERLDRASSHGPWTRAVLEVIAERPGRARRRSRARGVRTRDAAVQARRAQAEEPRPDDQSRASATGCRRAARRTSRATRSRVVDEDRAAVTRDPHPVLRSVRTRCRSDGRAPGTCARRSGRTTSGSTPCSTRSSRRTAPDRRTRSPCSAVASRSRCARPPARSRC